MKRTNRSSRSWRGIPCHDRRMRILGLFVIGWAWTSAGAAATNPASSTVGGHSQSAAAAAKPAAKPVVAAGPAGAAPPVVALAPAAGGRVVSVQISSLSPTQVSLVIGLSGPVRHAVYRVTDPPRVVIELANAAYAAPKEVAVSHPVVKKIRGGQYLEKPVKLSRIIVDGSRAMTSQVSQQGDRLVITLTSPAAPGPAPAAKPVVVAPIVVPKPVAPAAPVPEPVVKAPPAKPVPVVKQARKPAAVKKPSVAHAPHVARPAAPVRRAAKTPAAVRVPAAVKLPTPVAARPSSRPKPVPEAAETVKSFSLDFVKADIRDVLRILAIKGGVNIVPDDSVVGEVSIHLEGVTFDEALEIILGQKNYGYERITPTRYRVMAQKGTITELFTLNYQKASEMLTSVQAVLSSQGKMQVDQRTNTLIVTDAFENVRKVANLVRQLDVRTKQVMIDAQLIEVDISDDLELGINWSFSYAKIDGGNADYIGGAGGAGQVVAPAAGAGTVGGESTVLGTAGGQQVRTPQSGASPGGAGTVFPIIPTGLGGAITFGVVRDRLLLQGRLAALAGKGKTKLLSNPRIATLSNEEAKILIGDKVPYSETVVAVGGSAQQSIKFIDVGIKLSVRPSVSADSRVTLKVHPEVSLVRGVGVGGAPLLSTREADTNVIVKNGDTVVIGGLIRETDLQQINEVPLLGELPVLGYLFRHKVSKNERVELLVFLTPTIIE